ncbi:MAG: hypothetical protein ACOX7R_00500 [Acetivibrionales bacterium]
MNKYFDVRDRFGEDLVPGITLGRIADFRIPEEDIKILRELGRKKAEIANHPSMQENIKLWKSTNDLKMV